MHDLYPSTADAVQTLIPRLKKKGFQLVTVDELFYYKKIIENLCKLKGKFLIAFEIGEKQADSIVNIIFKYFTNVTICIEKDYNKRDRFIFVYRN